MIQQVTEFATFCL